MNRYSALLLVSWLGLTSLAGCAKPHFVQVGQGSGVVSLPENTNVWPTYYRDTAAAMIREKCPNGYDVVQEEEGVIGQTAHTDTHTETKPPPTLNFGAADQDSGDGKSGRHDSGSFGGISVPLGETKQNTKQTTEYRNLTEWRISYRAK